MKNKHKSCLFSDLFSHITNWGSCPGAIGSEQMNAGVEMQALSTDMIILSESADVPTTHSIGRWNLLVSCLIPTAEPFILKGVFHFLFILMLSLFNMEGEKKTHIMPLLSPLSPFEMLASKGGRSDKII